MENVAVTHNSPVGWVKGESKYVAEGRCVVKRFAQHVFSVWLVFYFIFFFSLLPSVFVSVCECVSVLGDAL